MTENIPAGDDFVDIGGGDVIDAKLMPVVADPAVELTDDLPADTEEQGSDGPSASV